LVGKSARPRFHYRRQPRAREEEGKGGGERFLTMRWFAASVAKITMAPKNFQLESKGAIAHGKNDALKGKGNYIV
jgi:hypothetical protein